MSFRRSSLVLEIKRNNNTILVAYEDTITSSMGGGVGMRTWVGVFARWRLKMFAVLGGWLNAYSNINISTNE